MSIDSQRVLSLVDVLAALARLREEASARRGMFLRVLLVAAAVGLLLAFGSQQEFTARARLLPYKSGSSAQGLSGLAGLAGIRLPSGLGDATVTPELYPAIAQTLEFRSAVLETPLRFSSEKRHATFIIYFDSLLSHSPVSTLYGVTIGLPRKARRELSALLSDNASDVASSDSLQPIRQFGESYLEHVRELDSRLTFSVDRKTSVVTVKGIMPDRYASADLVRIASQELMRRVIELEAKKADEQLQFITGQHARAIDRYERSHRELAAFLDGNRALSTATAGIQRDRLERETNLAFELVQQLSRELEQARLKVTQDTPVFTFLETVVVPTRRSSPNRLLVVVVCLIVGFASAVGIIVYDVVVRGYFAQLLVHQVGPRR